MQYCAVSKYLRSNDIRSWRLGGTFNSRVEWTVIPFTGPSDNIQLMDEVFRDIQNYQGQGKCNQLKPMADNTC